MTFCEYDCNDHIGEIAMKSWTIVLYSDLCREIGASGRRPSHDFCVIGQPATGQKRRGKCEPSFYNCPKQQEIYKYVAVYKYSVPGGSPTSIIKDDD